MITRTTAIKNWLNASTYSDLAERYHPGMEVQVNVIAGTPDQQIEKEFKGKKFFRYSDGIQEWGPYRIPRNANTDPVYEDIPQTWEFEKYLEAIGMTGWNWKDRVSTYVGFDFDSITTHAQGFIEAELNDVLVATQDLPYITSRYSTSGSGYHLEIKLAHVNTETHTEHAALARSLLGKMCADTGYDFSSKVDACGMVLWCWHRKMIGTDGLKLIKEGNILTEIPSNWQDHILVIKGNRTRAKPKELESDTQITLFDKLMSEKSYVKLDEEHKRLLEKLTEVGARWEILDDQLLICHTFDLGTVHKRFGFRGIYETNSTGREQGTDRNCFCYPIRNGGWAVRRYTLGITEAPSWKQDGSGYTKCYFNIEPDLDLAARALEGIEDKDRGFVFKEASIAAQAAESLGASITLPNNAQNRRTKLKEHKDGRLIVEVIKEDDDDGSDFKSWLADKKVWRKIYNVEARKNIEPEIQSFDDIIRHMISEDYSDYGFVVSVGEVWVQEPLTHVKTVLSSYGYSDSKIKVIIGNTIKKPFTIVNRPFEDEYLGNRLWNRNAAQLKYKPNKNKLDLHFPNWNLVLKHCGSGLDEVVLEDSWCKANGILSGRDYLKCWCASIFQHPEQPLPYLFFWGPENSGKSIFHESLRLLVTTGHVRADQSLLNPSGFNGELENAVICAVEETDLRRNKTALNRVKDWVTAIDFQIHKKNKTPYHVKNCTHWCQFSNDVDACPVGFGDTRITMLYVKPLKNIIAKNTLMAKLIKEAPDFISELIRIDLPEYNDRLALKVINTVEKQEMVKQSDNEVVNFLIDYTYIAPGYAISIDQLYRKFMEKCMSESYTKQRFIKEVVSTMKYKKGRANAIIAKIIGGQQGHWYIGNISFSEPKEKRESFRLEGEYLANYRART